MHFIKNNYVFNSSDTEPYQIILIFKTIKIKLVFSSIHQNHMDKLQFCLLQITIKNHINKICTTANFRKHFKKKILEYKQKKIINI